LRPFLKVTVLVEVISLFFLSFTQKARVMIRDSILLDIRRAGQFCKLSYEEMLTYQSFLLVRAMTGMILFVFRW
jgi:hypothetical protein